ncbi:hypothetical protein VDIAB_110525 [Vibrio diabolicus]|nr:hypothetical protein VDIAB_110525 [Vibrio diabolicus]
MLAKRKSSQLKIFMGLIQQPLHRAVILISVIKAQRTIYLGHELANDASVLRCR